LLKLKQNRRKQQLRLLKRRSLRPRPRKKQRLRES
jgi:hypothetical protein